MCPRAHSDRCSGAWDSHRATRPSPTEERVPSEPHRGPGRRPPWWWLLVVLGVAALVAATSTHPEPGRGADDPDPRAGPADVDAGPSARGFAWVARPEGQFTDGQIRDLATGYAYVVMDRAHGGASIARQLDDLRRIKRMNPAVRVLVYVNAAFWYDTNSMPDGWNAPFDPAWSLRDPTSGGPLRFSGRADREQATFVDLGNAAYRSYLLGLLRSWLDQAPIDGIAFDSVQPASADRVVLGHPGLTWTDVLTNERLDRYNNGLVELLRDTKALLGPGREVLFNGIADTPLAANRNLELVDHADIVVDEEFCVDNTVRHDPDTLREDLELMSQLAERGKRVLEKTNTRGAVGGPELQRLGRFCSGAFLIGWQPGSTFFKFGPDYSEDELSSNPRELAVQLGPPLGGYRETDGVARRDFRNGVVFVNLSDRPRIVHPRVSGTLLSRGETFPLDPEDAVPVEPQDALFVVRPTG